ncbi:hypothetical protein SSX86_032495 [Deinandra increscens subsp. villosa]|uniref:Superoxide dismutase copper/zinc binding domain-containing protein n=1 Tax=Deinandra increscens subsp. villosa TaxID=3103831 RepID=A0AAP0GHR1_9ASTR
MNYDGIHRRLCGNDDGGGGVAVISSRRTILKVRVLCFDLHYIECSVVFARRCAFRKRFHAFNFFSIANRSSIGFFTINRAEGVGDTIFFNQEAEGAPMTVTRELSSLKPTPRGFHVHALGVTTNGCMSTGADVVVVVGEISYSGQTNILEPNAEPFATRHQCYRLNVMQKECWVVMRCKGSTSTIFFKADGHSDAKIFKIDPSFSEICRGAFDPSYTNHFRFHCGTSSKG